MGININFDFSRVFLNIIIILTISLYFIIFFDFFEDLIIYILFILLIAFFLILLPFQKKYLSIFTLILWIPIFTILLLPLEDTQKTIETPMPNDEAPIDPAMPGGAGLKQPDFASYIIEILPILLIIFVFILLPLLIIFKKSISYKDEISSLKPDLLRSIFFLIYTCVGWTLFCILIRMDPEIAGIAAIITGLIVAGFDPNTIIGMVKSPQ